MPAKKIRRRSRSVRSAVGMFRRFAEELAAIISAQVTAALEAAMVNAREAGKHAPEAAPGKEIPVRRVRLRRRRSIPAKTVVVVAAEPAPRRKPGRPRKAVPVAAAPAPAPVKIVRRPAVKPAAIEQAPANPEPIAAPEPAVETDVTPGTTVTRPPDRLSRIRDSFRPGKVPVVHDHDEPPQIEYVYDEDDPPAEK
jgi:hypothetical protein